MKLIPLTKNKFALVDDSDFEWLSLSKWRYNNGRAIRSCACQGKEKRGVILMHRLINQTPAEFYTDHIDGNPLNNQRKNLRTVNNSQNQMNVRKHKGTSSYKGVSWSAKEKIWKAGIKVSAKTIYLGRFASENEAANAYNVAAKKYFGDFARLNKMEMK